MAPRKRVLKDRLLEGAVVNPESGCWEWTKSKFYDGYGRISVDHKSNGAHRISYELHIGAIPSGLCVCHKCDNRGCINPNHLFLGTNADNMADKVAKARQHRARGELNGSSKLSADDVLKIRSATGLTCEHLARQYGVSHGHVSKIRRCRTWAEGVRR